MRIRLLAAAVLVLALCWGVTPGHAQTKSLMYCYVGGSTPWVPCSSTALASVSVIPSPAAPTVSASASVTSLVLDAAPTTATGGVAYFHAENATSTGGYCILYNGTTAPSPGALTAANVLAFQLLPANGYCDWTSTDSRPISASTGAVVLLSSATTPFTYTTGTITGSIYGLAQ